MPHIVPVSRREAAARLLTVLTDACERSDAFLIGSMAQTGHADTFSDIDVRWVVPSPDGAAQLESLRSTLERVAPVESLRIDPDLRSSSKERLVFVRFADWPLAWRVDMHIRSEGLRGVEVQGADEWSAFESALMNIIATLKALARGRPAAAEELFSRAVHRVDSSDAQGQWPPRIAALLDRIEALDPSTAPLVGRIRDLATETLGT